jgi:hypothetical protein
MKNISIILLTLLTSCSSINFARDEGLVRRDEVSEMDDHSEAIPVERK